MSITSWIKNLGNNTLYYPGCLTKGVLKKEHENYKEIFNILGVDFIMLPDKEVCCGLPVLNGGYKKDVRQLARKNFELFKKYNIKKIITNCPSCYHMFKDYYPKLIKEWDISVEHVSVVILNALRRNSSLNFDNASAEIVTYHDPCHLGRYSKIYDEPRKVIEMLGGQIIEMKHNKETSLCCGGGGGVRANFPEIAKKEAMKRVAETPSQAERIISPCGLCFSNLKSSGDVELNGGKGIMKNSEQLSE
jgi:Fe-S oxidoreductase